MANLGIAVTKFIAYLLSGSSSMLAESGHSLADPERTEGNAPPGAYTCC